MNDVGKPCAGEPHARFERGPLANLATNEMDEKPQGQRPVPEATQDNQRPTSPVAFTSIELRDRPQPAVLARRDTARPTGQRRLDLPGIDPVERIESENIRHADILSQIAFWLSGH